MPHEDMQRRIPRRILLFDSNHNDMALEAGGKVSSICNMGDRLVSQELHS
jgi:hypothetical protein